MSARARCSECGKPITLKNDGTLRAHNGNEYDGIWGIRCDGAGRLPVARPEADR